MIRPPKNPPLIRFVLFGGRFDGMVGSYLGPGLKDSLNVGGLPYLRIDDPDTGDYLGGYYYCPTVN